MELGTPGTRKYPSTSALLASSAGLGWSGLSAELRRHGVGEAQAIVPQHVEICLVIDGNNDGIVKRTGSGICQEAAPRTGTIWLSPVGVAKLIAITSVIPETAHLYLQTALFDQLKDDFNLSGTPAASICHAAGVFDEVIDQLGRSIVANLATETTTSRMYVEAAAAALAARLVQNHCESGSSILPLAQAQPVDRARLCRVLDYIGTHIEDDITLDDLAKVGCQSRFQFARKFASAMGVTPMRYLSRLRLDKAMAELASCKLPVAQIALNAGFSSQASFTRAFGRTTGMTPKEYQRHRR